MSKNDVSPYLHAALALSIQVGIGLLSNMWGVGGALGCMWFVAREHTQAEYRWIAKLGSGKRSSMPWWGGFDPRAWDTASLMDWLVPVISCAVIYIAIV